jgi:hypothetical protein
MIAGRHLMLLKQVLDDIENKCCNIFKTSAASYSKQNGVIAKARETLSTCIEP